MLIDIVKILAGLLLLLGAGEFLVKGSVALALRLGIPSLIVGLTVVAFGTSAPELLVSVNAALGGQPGLALGNVVGSNVVNMLVILGLPALIAVIHSSQIDTRRSYAMMLAASVLVIGLAFMGTIGRWQGLVLLGGLILILWDNVRSARAHRNARTPEDDLGDPHMAWWKIIGFICVGFIGLAIGADLLVDGAVAVARIAGLSETVIGLTLVAIGTSLPELVTSVVAAMRKQADVALGNVIGSNIFNLMAILGTTAVIAPMPVPDEMLRFDLWVMLAATLALAPFVFWRRDIGRGSGIVLLLGYVLYTVVLLWFGLSGGVA
ncbi:cation:H+ antiporter [Rhodobacter sp. JA431]|uniref:calcium/sodium antiporter n=1 Tax=Rhodobacter sp. JA431 TaxID=570013 RepID=UPI000BDB557E|nr:calcium/sodium antiporter [Rhodobacter sp. JA431]SOC17546.1 cation:H+ antiporter [Rhodobacter sp. JA431]